MLERRFPEGRVAPNHNRAAGRYFGASHHKNRQNGAQKISVRNSTFRATSGLASDDVFKKATKLKTLQPLWFFASFLEMFVSAIFHKKTGQHFRCYFLPFPEGRISLVVHRFITYYLRWPRRADSKNCLLSHTHPKGARQTHEKTLVFQWFLVYAYMST